jgi:hypothetical protein
MSEDYKRQIAGLTSEYERSFAEYQRSVDEKMAPYQEQVARYQNEAQPQFEEAMAGYTGRFEEYLKNLQSVYDNPLEKVNAQRRRIGRNQHIIQYKINGEWVSERNLPEGYTSDNGLYRKRKTPKFNETAPTAPEVPLAPEVPSFDGSQFEQRRNQLQEGFKRETAERRGARMNAVQRGRGRGMLQGA